MKKKRIQSIDQVHSENGTVTIQINSENYPDCSEIMIASHNVIYVQIGDKQIYIDNSTKELIVDVNYL